MTPIFWDKSFSVGVKIIDEQHRRFIGIVNELEEAIQAGRVKEELAAILAELDDYTSTHFKTEEGFMDEFECDKEMVAAHKEAHRSMLAKLDEIKQAFARDPQSLSINLIEYLRDWLHHHTLYNDKKYVKCFHDHGLT